MDIRSLIKQDDCIVCKHPGVDRVNELLFAPVHKSLHQIKSIIEREYPNIPLFAIPTLSRHKKHVKAQMDGMVEEAQETVVEKTKKVSGTKVHVDKSIKNFLQKNDKGEYMLSDGTLVKDLDLGFVSQTVMAICLENIIKDPSSAGPRTLVEIMNVIVRKETLEWEKQKVAMLNGSSVEQEDLLTVYAKKAMKAAAEFNNNKIPEVIDQETDEYKRQQIDMIVAKKKEYGLIKTNPQEMEDLNSKLRALANTKNMN